MEFGGRDLKSVLAHTPLAAASSQLLVLRPLLGVSFGHACDSATSSLVLRPRPAASVHPGKSGPCHVSPSDYVEGV